MTKVALLFSTGTEECEALNVVDILRRAAMDVTIISISGDRKVTGSHDITIMADEIIEEHDFAEDDVLVIPGGMPGTLNLEASDKVQNLIDEFVKDYKFTIAFENNSYPGYNRISNLSRVLDELAQQNEIVNLQDSILLLSSLSKKEQIDAAKREIAKIEAKEAQEYEQRKKQELENQKLDVEIENMAVMDRQAMGGNRKAEWYFYNPRIVVIKFIVP